MKLESIQGNPDPIFHTGVHQYAIRLGDLPFFSDSIDIHQEVREMDRLFRGSASLPGLILTNHGAFWGLITRDQLYEALGRPFGVELYRRMPVKDFYNECSTPPLVVEADARIDEVVKLGLDRNMGERYAPVVVKIDDTTYRLVDMVTILCAQRDILEKLYEDVQHLSNIDPLTNTNNRRGFFEAAQAKIQALRKKDSVMSVLMIDLDNFKRVNDTYGHIVGDSVICAVAQECQKAIRATDLFGRYGGEEFIALLPDTSVEVAITVAGRIRERIQNLKTFSEGFQVSVTVSIGVSYTHNEQENLDRLLTQADQAMYAAKYSGRNQVILWDPVLGQKAHKDFIVSLEQPPSDSCLGSRDTTGESHPDAARIYDETIEGWVHALELRDKETRGHAQRVSRLTIELAKIVGISTEEQVHIRRGALLHDIGKIAIPDSILFKPGKLTEAEWEIMRKHPAYALELLSPIHYLQKSIDIPYGHHEHWDGSGYPRGLKGQEIPLAARIFTIIDVWDALSTNRCYRLAWETDTVKQYLLEESGRMFDPDIVEAFFHLLNTPSPYNFGMAEAAGWFENPVLVSAV